MLDNDDFNLGYEWQDDGDTLYVNHLWLDPEQRGDTGSYILETLVRVAYYEGAETVKVSIGGGERAEAFLVKNGFQIIRQRHYREETKEYMDEPSEYGVDAVREIDRKV